MEASEHKVSISRLSPTWTHGRMVCDASWWAACTCGWSHQSAGPRYLPEGHAQNHLIAAGAIAAPAVVTPAAHEREGLVRLGFTSDYRLRCACGQGWTGPRHLVEADLAEHLGKYASTPEPTPLPLPLPQPLPSPAPAPPRRLR